MNETDAPRDPQKPSNLNEAQTKGWDLLAAGASVTDVARQTNRSTGTVQQWITRWRKQDPNLFRDERREAASQAMSIARTGAERQWQTQREEAALRFGTTAQLITTRITSLLDELFRPTVVGATIVPGPQGRDVKDLALAAAILSDKAELLSGNPTSHSRRSVPSDQWVRPPTSTPEIDLPRDERIARVVSIAGKLVERQADTG